MARLHIVSDLHTEFSPFVWPSVEADASLVAGDMGIKGRFAFSTQQVQELRRPLIAIAGNHEFYSAKIDTAVEVMRQQAQDAGAVFLEREEAVVAGVRILGCTLWSDFRLFAGDNLADVVRDANYAVGDRYSGGMNDFRRIRVAKDNYRKFRPKDAATLFTQSVAWLRERLAIPFNGATVVMTHHAPSMLCLPKATRQDRMSCAYASHLDSLIEEFQPNLWIWGHIHDSVPEFQIGRTRMLSNPRGYIPDQPNPNFQPNWVVDL
jgi:predicted phosphohydrolase